jgi:hypothetical protein
MGSSSPITRSIRLGWGRHTATQQLRVPVPPLQAAMNRREWTLMMPLSFFDERGYVSLILRLPAGSYLCRTGKLYGSRSWCKDCRLLDDGLRILWRLDFWIVTVTEKRLSVCTRLCARLLRPCLPRSRRVPRGI